MTSDWSWRIPVILQAVPSLIVMAFVFLLPESPRWLFQHGKTEAARAVLVEYHGAGNTQSAVVALQLQEIAESVNLEEETSDKRWWDYRSLFNTRAMLYRVWLTLLITTFSQFIGGSVIR